MTDEWVRVDGRYSPRQGRTHYMMASAGRFEARVFALPRRYENGRPSFTERFTFEIVAAGSRRGEGPGRVEAIVTGAAGPWRSADDAKQAALAALDSQVAAAALT